MKSLSTVQLSDFCDWLKIRLLGAQLQDLWTDGETLILQFYRSSEVYVLASLRQQAPLVWLQIEKPSLRKSPKPVSLFLASHARGRRLLDLSVQLERGRSLLWTLGGTDVSCQIVMDLIPRNANLTVCAQEKQISWNKQRELPPQQPHASSDEIPDWESWCREAAKSTLEGERARVPQQQAPSLPSRAIEKKEKALAILASALESTEENRYRELGEHLKTFSQAPDHLLDLFDQKKSVSENRAAAFHKAKELERKKVGSRQRHAILMSEVAKLREAPVKGAGPLPLAVPMTAAVKAMRKGESQGRKLVLPGGFEAVIGKSGADNLAILRQTRAWDLWVHLKDEPGAHAIIFRGRDQEVPSTHIRQVAEWVWHESKGKKMSLPGLKFEVVVVECRFVRPIKGDRLGRVNYQNPRVYAFASKS